MLSRFRKFSLTHSTMNPMFFLALLIGGILAGG
jgi:hypothetical protein